MNSLRIALISTFIIFFVGIFAAYYIAKAPRMLKGCLTGLPAGNVTLYYQIAKPVVVLTSGGNDIGYNKSGILATGFAPDVIEDRKKKAQESLKKAEEDKAKKEAEAKKKEAW